MTNALNVKKEIAYEKCFVAFLDVLGFNNLVYSKNKEDHTKLEEYFGIVNEIIKDIQSISLKSEIKSIIISDSIILSIPESSDHLTKIDNLRHICIAIGLIQRTLALKNIWLRGAISCGDSYFNSEERQIVGPAYSNAYLLEENQAIFPRVILDSKIIEEVKSENAGHLINLLNMKNLGGLKFENWKGNILFDWENSISRRKSYIDQDIPLFIDYLYINIDFTEESLILILENIRSIMYKDTKYYGKYRWVTDYIRTRYQNNNFEYHFQIAKYLHYL